VRSARDGETLVALNGETYQLDSSNLVIADPEGAVALAGVIGGAVARSRIPPRGSCSRARISRVQRAETSTKIRLRTDASQRFEKAQDPVNTLRGLLLALDCWSKSRRGFVWWRSCRRVRVSARASAG